MPASSAVTASSQAGPSNPFSKRHNGAETQTQSKPLKKTGSFFDRVDASNGLSSTGAVLTKTTSSGKQSTLFGLPPPTIKEGSEKKNSNRGRKRKSDAATTVDGEKDCVEVTSVRRQPKNLQNFFGGKPTSSTAESKKLTSASNKKARSASASDREDSVMASAENMEEGEENDIEATQEQEEEVPPMDGDNTSNESVEAEAITPAEMAEDELPPKQKKSPAKEVSSMSRLAAFKFSAADKPPTTAVEEQAEVEA